MVSHVRRVESLLSPTGLWDAGFQFGDWLDPTAPPEEAFLSKADKGVVATACLYRDAHIVRDTARLLGRHEDAEHFSALAERTRAAFNEHYVRPEGIIHSDAETPYALAIVFGLLDSEDEQLAGKRLRYLVRQRGDHNPHGCQGGPT